MKRITKFLTDTRSVAAEKRVTAYEVATDNVLQTTFLTDEFHARLQSCHLGSVHMIELLASPRRSERTAAQIASDRHDRISVQLVIKGSAHGEAAGHKVMSAPDTIMILDFSQPFWIKDNDDRNVINVSFPRNIVARNIADVRSLHGKVLDTERSAILAAHLQAIAPRLETMPVYAAPVLADIILDLLLIALDQDPARAEVPKPDRRALMIERAKQLIDSRIGSDDLGPDWLITKLSISRSDLYSLFEEHGGVARFIWRRRLEAARAALLDRDDLRRIGEIAFAFGFSTEAHFARAFKIAFGKTAGNTRRDRS